MRASKVINCAGSGGLTRVPAQSRTGSCSKKLSGFFSRDWDGPLLRWFRCWPRGFGELEARSRWVHEDGARSCGSERWTGRLPNLSHAWVDAVGRHDGCPMGQSPRMATPERSLGLLDRILCQ